METNELSDWSLTQAVAERLGWSAIKLSKERIWMGRPPSAQKLEWLTAYHESFDLCFRDLLPVLESRGIGALRLEGAANSSCRWWVELHGGGAGIVRQGATPAEAFARAFLAATAEEPAANA